MIDESVAGDGPPQDSTRAPPGGLATAPLAGPFGVRVHGADVAALPADPAAGVALRALLDRHRVVVVDGMRLDPDAFVAFAAMLGTLRPARVRHASLPPAAGAYVFVGARSASDTPVAAGPGDAAHGWHADYSGSSVFPRLSIMYALTVSPDASRTGFADMAAVYDALPERLRQEIDGLQAHHYPHPHGVDVLPQDAQVRLSWAARSAGATHPLVMRDGRGRRLLCLPPHVDSAVVGRDETASRALLEDLWSHVERFGRPWEYRQSPGEILIWDNHALLHRRSAWPPHQERLVWFVSTN